MKNFRVWILFFLFQFAALALVWFVSTEEQRRSYLSFIGISVPTDSEEPEERLPLNLTALNRITRNEIDPVFHCGPKTTSINKVDQNGVYRWVDEQGNTHFSDRPPPGVRSENLTGKYTERYQFFTVKIINRGGSIPVDMQTRLSVDTRQIFSVLSHFLSLDQLRQVHLEVHVFDSPNRFKRFKQQIAPSLSNNVSGFYSPNLNLVAINRQSNDETTLAIARHEAAHVIVSGLFGNIPTWFTEGVAEYFEQMSISGQLKIIGVNRSWMKLLTEQQRAGQLMTITEYLQYDRQSWRDQDQNTMYATAWSIVHFLMSSRQGKRLMTQYMDALVADRCQGINSQAFFNRWYRAIS